MKKYDVDCRIINNLANENISQKAVKEGQSFAKRENVSNGSNKTLYLTYYLITVTEVIVSYTLRAITVLVEKKNIQTAFMNYNSHSESDVLPVRENFDDLNEM